MNNLWMMVKPGPDTIRIDGSFNINYSIFSFYQKEMNLFKPFLLLTKKTDDL